MSEREKERIEDYGIESAVWVGEKRIVFGINKESREKPRYMTCIVTDDGLFGRYEGITTDDYFEAIRRFGDDIRTAGALLETKQQIDGMEDTGCLCPEDLMPVCWQDSIRECPVAIKPDVLYEGCRNIGNQLYYVVGGFGAEANSRGNACYGWNLCRRTYERIERSEVMGIVPDTLLPDIAKQTLEDLRQGRLRYRPEDEIQKAGKTR